MKLAIFLEGKTEGCLREFLGCWLEDKLTNQVRIQPVKFNGVGEYLKEIAPRANRALQDPGVLGVIGLIDFYASTMQYPDGPVATQYQWAKKELEHRVNHPRFHQHFAVHETEAWLLSDLDIFPPAIRGDLPKTQKPETVNHRHPPSHRLKDIYHRRLARKYSKPLDGASLFRQLNPQTAYNRCPHLKLLLDDILTLATGTQ